MEDHHSDDTDEKDELLLQLNALIKAIKFANPNFTLKQVHQEVVSHELFSNFSLQKIKKQMKQLGLIGRAAVEALQEPALHLFTVGQESKSIPLSNNFNNEVKSRSSTTNEDKMNTNQKDNLWVQVELDVPADRSGDLPYQAIIRGNKNDTGISSGSKGEIVKIQKVDATCDAYHPLLLYNKKRNRKTFIHTNSSAHIKLKEMIIQAPINKGNQGAIKAYFWARPTTHDKMIEICISELAPTQPW